MKILVAPDSFKESLDAAGVAIALKKGISRVLAGAEVALAPMADGGEGTVKAVIQAAGGTTIPVEVHDPLLRKTGSFFGITGEGKTAVIEMAAASGLELLNPHERNPWNTSTYGTGELIRASLDKGCRDIILGIGGSATNDGGMGMAAALGIRFTGKNGKEIKPTGGSLGEISLIDMEKLDHRILKTRIRVACDVTNPLTGKNGAAFVYGPQKGADPGMVKKLDGNLAHFARLIRDQHGKDIGKIPGAGAAGGLGAGLMAFLDAELVKGFELIAAIIGLEEKIQAADLVITGEGKIDEQTMYGKTAFGVATLAKKYHKPVIAIAGTFGPGAEKMYTLGFDLMLPVVDRPMSLEEALSSATWLTEQTGERIGRFLKICLEK